MASSAILRSLVVVVLSLSSLGASAQCNLDKKASQPIGNTPVPNYAAWVEQDVHWIATKEEKDAFKKLQTDQERDQFIDQFWIRRDPTPETILNEFRREHYRRIRYANEHFAIANVPGWNTDRGRIYIVYGKPDEIISKGENGVPSEIWRYRYLDDIGQDVHIEFVDRCRCGRFAQLTDLDKIKASRTGVQIVDPIFVPTGTVPLIRLRKLDEIVTHKICLNQVPVSVDTRQIKATDFTVLVPITIEVEDEDVAWKADNNKPAKTLEVYGRLSDQTGYIREIFEDTVRQNADQMGHDLLCRYTASLRSGRYHLDIAVRDLNSDQIGTWTGLITVR